MKVYILPLLSFMTGIAKGNEGGIAPLGHFGQSGYF